MDKLAFFSSIVSSLAWPTTTVIAAIALRRPIRELLRLLTKVRYGDFELNFEQNIQKLELQAKAALQDDEAPVVPQRQTIATEIAVLAEASPRAAVIESWLNVSRAALSALKRRGVSLPAGKDHPPLAIERSLEGSGLLTKDQLKLLKQLRVTRNAAVHGSTFKVDSGAALAYAAIASKLTRHLEQSNL